MIDIVRDETLNLDLSGRLTDESGREVVAPKVSVSPEIQQELTQLKEKGYPLEKVLQAVEQLPENKEEVRNYAENLWKMDKKSGIMSQ